MARMARYGGQGRGSVASSLSGSAREAERHRAIRDSPPDPPPPDEHALRREEDMDSRSRTERTTGRWGRGAGGISPKWQRRAVRARSRRQLPQVAARGGAVPGCPVFPAVPALTRLQDEPTRRTRKYKRVTRMGAGAPRDGGPRPATGATPCPRKGRDPALRIHPRTSHGPGYHTAARRGPKAVEVSIRGDRRKQTRVRPDRGTLHGPWRPRTYGP